MGGDAVAMAVATGNNRSEELVRNVVASGPFVVQMGRFDRYG